jgi:protein-tyrosine phosphatase
VYDLEVVLVSVLFVCLGNICRSPIAQGIFEDLLRREGLDDEVIVDSAGTGAWHIGQPPDTRGQESAGKRGVDLSGQRARRITLEDCQRFDYVIAMDRDNYESVSALCRESKAEVRLFLDYAPDLSAEEVPDPYYGGPDGFEHVLDLVEKAARGLLDDVRKRHLESRV